MIICPRCYMLLFYVTLFLVYFQPPSSYLAGPEMVGSVLHTMGTLMLNPFNYSLRNRNMKRALWRLFDLGKHYD
ncbi:hypothetical protein A6R68_23638, partial [Neotoma lepida]